MRFTKLTNVLLVAMFLAVLCSPVALDAWLRHRHVKLPGRALFRKTDPVQKDDFMSGIAGTKLEQGALNDSYFARWLIANHNELAYRTLGRAAPAVWLGKERWLFVPDRVREITKEHRRTAVERDVRGIVRVRDRLLEHGARLFVALVPNCARVYPERAYRDGRMPPEAARFLPELAAALSGAGVAVADLTEAMIEQKRSGPAPFYSDDHHWTSHGALAAARAIHAALPPDLLAILSSHEQGSRFRALWSNDAESESSLLTRLGFFPGGDLERSFRTRAPRARFAAAKHLGFPESCGSYWSTSYGLFGSPQFFDEAAHCPVRIVMRAGGGSGYAATTDLRELDAGRVQLGGRHLVIWEIPEYHLVADDQSEAALEAWARERTVRSPLAPRTN